MLPGIFDPAKYQPWDCLVVLLDFLPLCVFMDRILTKVTVVRFGTS